MNGWKREDKEKRICLMIALAALLMILLTGCGAWQAEGIFNADGAENAENAPGAGERRTDGQTAGLHFQEIPHPENPYTLDESGADGTIDFAVLQEWNPDVVGWLYVPDTTIDVPVLRERTDGQYENHNAYGAPDTRGAIYMKRDSSPDLLDFHTVLYGAAQTFDGDFAALYAFADPDFFAAHDTMYYYQPYGTMIYRIMGAWEQRESSASSGAEDGARTGIFDAASEWRTGTDHAGSEERTGTDHAGSEGHTGTDHAGSEGRTGISVAGSELHTGTSGAENDASGEREEQLRRKFLDELKTPAIGKNLREGTDALVSSLYFLTLRVKRAPTSDRHYIVVGVLIGAA